MNCMHHRILAVLTGLLVLSGCALSPQVVSVQPPLDTTALPQDGAASTLAFAVKDVRTDAVVGYRGGVYDTATITLSGDSIAHIQAGLEQALAARGFSVVPAGTPASVTLLVELVELGYKVTQGQVTRVVEVTSTIRASSQSGEVTRTGEYRDTRTQESVKPPSDSQNEALINDVLSAALQRLVADAELFKY